MTLLPFFLSIYSLFLLKTLDFLTTLRMLKLAVISLGFILFITSAVCTRCPEGCLSKNDHCLLCKPGKYQSGETCIKCADGFLTVKNALRNKRDTHKDPEISQRLQKYHAWKSCVVANFKIKRIISHSLAIYASFPFTAGNSAYMDTMGISNYTYINCSIACAGRQCDKSGCCSSGCIEDKSWCKLCEHFCFENCSLCDGNCFRCKNDAVFGPQYTTCPTKCLNGSCEQKFGICMFGCKNGFYGDTSQLAHKSNCWNTCRTCRQDDGACGHDVPDVVRSKQADREKFGELHLSIICILGTVCVFQSALLLFIGVQSRTKCQKRTLERKLCPESDVANEQANSAQPYHSIQITDQNQQASGALARSESTRNHYIHPI